MNTEKLLRGESKNIEYKSVLPEQSEKIHQEHYRFCQYPRRQNSDFRARYPEISRSLPKALFPTRARRPVCAAAGEKFIPSGSKRGCVLAFGPI